jgi:menaquinone-specific isochorismate synthase
MTTTALLAEREPTRLFARTREVECVDDLLDLLPSPHGVLSWVRESEGIVGWGNAARIEVSGPERFERAEETWRHIAAGIAIDDEVGQPGSGPVAFASFAFGDQPGHSVLIVPRIVVGRKAGKSWITEIGGDGEELLEAHTPVATSGSLRWREGSLSAHRWRLAAAEAVRRMRIGELDKVVLARDLMAEADEPIDQRFVLRQLATRHRSCWTFAVDGLVGATPELLLRRQGTQVNSRVLAGSTWPGADDQYLLHSPAYREEHRYAVESLVASLTTHCTSMQTIGPSVLQLRNIAHLSTDVTGTLSSMQPSSLLQLAKSVHPTAAVGGTPPAEAIRAIGELEQRQGLERGRYAAPVGWIDTNGDGELGIALRCARISDRHARLFAGCGLIADSDPDAEVQETHAKFAAMREALGE